MTTAPTRTYPLHLIAPTETILRINHDALRPRTRTRRVTLTRLLFAFLSLVFFALALATG